MSWHDELTTWEPYCGAEFHGTSRSGYRVIAGHKPIVCDRNAHGSDTQHCDSETGIRWW